jgi:tRNA threonylcarbamoyladenosine biosynthesis protein TsaE
MPTVEIVSASAEETERLAARLARELRAGDVVLLSGELGAGKTTFVRGASRALGVTARVTSPTFTIGHRYPGGVDVSHVDRYRIRGNSAAEGGGREPKIDGAVVFVGWPEAGADALPPARMCVQFDHVGPETRRITVAADEEALLQEVAGADPGVRHGD